MTLTPTAPDTHFSPEDDAKAFRSALSAFATGVTVVTTNTPDGPVGITANSFASVSLDPPLVLWCPAKGSHRFKHFDGAERYAIHVLAADQQAVCDAFVKSKTAFEDVDWTPSNAGVPLLHGVAACFECSLEATHEGGDHTIVVGRVIRAHHSSAQGLVFKMGKFGGFAANS